MNNEVIVIDLGSSFTKVGIRPALSADSRLLSLSSKRQGDEITVPSLAGVEETATGRRYQFGAEILTKKPGKGFEFRENWKRSLFTLPRETVATPTGWEALLSSPEFTSLASRFRVRPSETEALRLLIRQAQHFVGIPPLPQPMRTASSNQGEIQDLTTAFFGWLLALVSEHLKAKANGGIQRPNAIPVRVTIPAFDSEPRLPTLPGCQVIRTAIEAAGWQMDAKLPFISEPFANVIGFATRGVNVAANNGAWRPEMFRHSPLALALKQGPSDKAITVDRMFVVDVGAYTTDVGLIGCDPDRFSDESSWLERLHCHVQSIETGVLELQREVLAEAQPDPQFDPNDASPAEREQYFRNRLEESRRAGRNQTDKQRRLRVKATLVEFADRVAKGVAERCQHFVGLVNGQQQRSDRVRTICYEIAISGGGSYIPEITEAILLALSQAGFKFLNTLLPNLKNPNENGILESDSERRHHTSYLSQMVIRGSTAIGGASVFFG